MRIPGLNIRYNTDQTPNINSSTAFRRNRINGYFPFQGVMIYDSSLVAIVSNDIPSTCIMASPLRNS